MAIRTGFLITHMIAEAVAGSTTMGPSAKSQGSNTLPLTRTRKTVRKKRQPSVAEARENA